MTNQKVTMFLLISLTFNSFCLSLTKEEYRSLIDGSLIKKHTEDLATLDKSLEAALGLPHALKKQASLKEKINALRDIKKISFWHHDHPSIGITKKTRLFSTRKGYIPHMFSLWELAPQKGEGVKVGLIDSQSYHGFINEQIIHSIAPRAQTKILNAFNDDIKSWPSMIVDALKKAASLGIPLINMSLKIADTIDPHSEIMQNLKALIDVVPYAVVSAGNNGTNKESYPARFDTVPFDVGAFYFDKKTGKETVCSFSQYEEGRGPKCIAPGYNIMIQNKEGGYTFHHGTSLSASLVSGLLALLLAEFQKDFSRKQILQTCYTFCSYKNEWSNKVLLGIIDIRSSIFSLHVIKKIATFSFKEKLDAVYQIINKEQSHYSSLVKAINHVTEAATKLLKSKSFKAEPFNDTLDKNARAQIKKLFKRGAGAHESFIKNPYHYFKAKHMSPEECWQMVHATDNYRKYWKKQSTL